MVSQNLYTAAVKHNDYLINSGIISHSGKEGSTAMQRCLDEGASALNFGEVIGFSPTLDELFVGWLTSPTHLKVLTNPDWNWAGVSVKEYNGVFVAVAEFSTGNIGTTELLKSEGTVIFSGLFIKQPQFIGDFKIKDFTLVGNKFKIVIKPEEKYVIIKAKTPGGEVSDRVEVFF